MYRIFATLITAAVLTSLCTSNKSLSMREHALEGDTIQWKSSKWYDKGNTFALRVYALPVANFTSKIQAMETCKKALEVNAGAQLIGFFNGVKIESAAGTKNAQLTGMATTAETSGIIRHVRLIDVTMVADNPGEGCTALAIVTQEGLQERVEKGAFLVK